MYKVFYNQRTVLFTESTDRAFEKAFDVYKFENKESLKNKIEWFIEQSNKDTLLVICNDADMAFREYCHLYEMIEAAGGLVKNNKNEMLFIYRRDKWDLPKGKIEKNEQIEKAAVREVEEECGISNPEIVRELVKTYHTYKLNEKDILKRTYWFEMFYDGNELLNPQLEEDITETVWMNKSQLQKVYENTFPSIIEVIKSDSI